MKEINLIAISFAYPPLAYPRSIQVARLLKHIPCSTVLLCGDENEGHKDFTIEPEAESGIDKCLRVKFNVLPWQKILGQASRYLHFPVLYKVPDIYIAWKSMALKVIEDFIVKNNYWPDVMATFGQPMTDHLIGMELKKRYKIHWIAHFSDPWVDNPFINYDILSSQINKKFERNVIEGADAIIFTSPETIELVMRKYSQSLRKKVHYVPHCYDKTIYQKDLNPSRDQYIIRSIGNFYGHRSPKPFYEAIEILIQNEPSLFDNVVIEVVGSMGKFDELANQFPLARRVLRFTNSVPYLQSIFLMQTAHCLITIDAPAETSVFFPSKLVDYIGAERFIFAICPPGATERVVKKMGGLIANPANIDDIVNALRTILKLKPHFLSDKTKKYEKETVCKQFVNIIESVL